MKQEKTDDKQDKYLHITINISFMEAVIMEKDYFFRELDKQIL